LFSLVDYALAEGRNPHLSAYVAGATHWRLIVVGRRVAAAYRNVALRDDFRTAADEGDPALFAQAAPRALAAAAVRAVRVLETEFGGVDVLQDRRGRGLVLECNFPCYFAHPQQAAGVDVAGMMVEHLLVKARRLQRRPPRLFAS
jgi:glutathione synthase/RimK-type ligase-like ATP-grasp enzyme